MEAHLKVCSYDPNQVKINKQKESKSKSNNNTQIRRSERIAIKNSTEINKKDEYQHNEEDEEGEEEEQEEEEENQSDNTITNHNNNISASHSSSEKNIESESESTAHQLNELRNLYSEYLLFQRNQQLINNNLYQRSANNIQPRINNNINNINNMNNISSARQISYKESVPKISNAYPIQASQKSNSSNNRDRLTNPNDSNRKVFVNSVVTNNLEQINSKNRGVQNLFNVNPFQRGVILTPEQMEELQLREVMRRSEESYKEEEEKRKNRADLLRNIGVEIVLII